VILIVPPTWSIWIRKLVNDKLEKDVDRSDRGVPMRLFTKGTLENHKRFSQDNRPLGPDLDSRSDRIQRNGI
jgi:hypothetical protein